MRTGSCPLSIVWQTYTKAISALSSLHVWVKCASDCGLVKFGDSACDDVTARVMTCDTPCDDMWHLVWWHVTTRVMTCDTPCDDMWHRVWWQVTSRVITCDNPCDDIETPCDDMWHRVWWQVTSRVMTCDTLCDDMWQNLVIKREFDWYGVVRAIIHKHRHNWLLTPVEKDQILKLTQTICCRGPHCAEISSPHHCTPSWRGSHARW
jgi:hypothetical protein